MILTWWIIGIIGFFLFLMLYKSQNVMAIFSLLKRNIFIVLIVAFILFVSFSVYRVSVSHDVSFKSFDGIVGAGKVYLTWLKSIFVNLGKVTGYAVQQDWVLNNSTINVTK